MLVTTKLKMMLAKPTDLPATSVIHEVRLDICAAA